MLHDPGIPVTGWASQSTIESAQDNADHAAFHPGYMSQLMRQLVVDPESAKSKSDLIWSKKVASIAISTCLAAKALPEELAEKCTEIVSEEIYIRLIIGDRPSNDE